MLALTARRLASGVLLCVLALLGACGTGGASSTAQEFFFQAVGPQGGTASGGPVTVVFPAGAVAAVTAVAVLPEANLLPITQPGNDPCSYDYAGPLHCVGPIDLNLLVPGQLVLRYELADLPPLAVPADLVVLVSDPTLGHTAMQAVGDSSVVLDPAAQTLTLLGYSVLSHVAVGVRTCPPRDLLVEDGVAQIIAQGVRVAGPLAQPTLWSVDTAGASAPAVLDLGGFFVEAWVPSPSGTRLLLQGYPVGANLPVLATAPWPAGGTPVTVLEGDPLAQLDLSTQDGSYGWLRAVTPDTLFGVQAAPVFGLVVARPHGLGGGLLDPVRVLRRDGQALSPASELAVRSGFSWALDDVRQSDDGSTLALRWRPNFSNQAVVQGTFVPPGMDLLTPAGTFLSRDLVPPGTGGGDPRFLPGSTQLSLLSTDGLRAESWTTAGVPVATLLVPPGPGPNASLAHVGFAVAPDNSTYALVSLETVSLNAFVQTTIVTIGRLAGGPVATLTFSEVGLDELAWHPSGAGVFVDLKGRGVEYVRVQLPVGQGPPTLDAFPMPADDMRSVDVNRVDGRIVVTVPPGGTRNVVAGGVYVLPADASTAQQVSLPGLTAPAHARWLRSWRTTPGQDGLRVR